MINKLKYFLLGHFLFKPQINIEKEWLGNSYGGFFICPKELNENSIVYSVGIGEDISFDIDLISKINCKIYAFDPTPKSINWIENNNSVPKENFVFHHYGISAKSGLIDFYLPKNPNHVSGSIIKNSNVNNSNSIKLNFFTISQVLKKLGHSKIDLLKIDIEGEEFEVLKSILIENITIKQIVVEFHPNLIKKGKSKTREIIKALNNSGYKCFGVSSSYSEFSFIKTEN
jgi:FkbM family methyltransferase